MQQGDYIFLAIVVMWLAFMGRSFGRFMWLKWNAEKYDIRYRLLKIENSNRHAVEVLNGSFAGVVVAYGMVTPEEQPDGTLLVRFEFQIVKGDKSLENDEFFKKFAFELLKKVAAEQLGDVTLNQEA